MNYKSNRERAVMATQAQYIVDTLMLYPQGLTMEDMMHDTPFTVKKISTRVIKKLLNSGEVFRLNDTDHSHTYVHKDYYPFVPPGVRHTNGIKVSKYYKDNPPVFHKVLTVLEKYPNGRTIGQIIKETGVKGISPDNMYNIIRFHMGTLIESPDEDVRLPLMDRRYRVIGADSDETISYFNEGRAISLIYYDYERATVEIKYGKVDALKIKEMIRLVQDIEEYKDHTPKYVNMKIRFKEEGEPDFVLNLTNTGYFIYRGSEATERTFDEVINMLSRYRGN